MKRKKNLVYIVLVLFFFQAALMGRGLASNAEETDKATQQSTQNPGESPTDQTTDDAADGAVTGSSFFGSLWQDQGRILSSPLRIPKKRLFLWGGVALVTAALIATDQRTYRGLKRFQEKHPWVDDLSPQVTRLGLGEWNLGIGGAFYLGGLLFKDPRAKETARLVVLTFFHTGIVAQLGKHLTGRQRPSWDNGQDHWAGPAGFFGRYREGELSRYDAFPSGHTISIFGTATVIAEMYRHTVWVPVISYSAAALCGLSRITEDTHWLSDVFLAAVMGYAIGKYITKKRNRLQPGPGNLNLYPLAHRGQLGIGLQYRFN